MVHTVILGRRLDRPVINLGFSGNARHDGARDVNATWPIFDPAVFVLDCLLEHVCLQGSLEPLCRRSSGTLRKLRPETPIVLARDPVLPHCAGRSPLSQKQRRQPRGTENGV